MYKFHIIWYNIDEIRVLDYFFSVSTCSTIYYIDDVLLTVRKYNNNMFLLKICVTILRAHKQSHSDTDKGICVTRGHGFDFDNTDFISIIKCYIFVRTSVYSSCVWVLTIYFGLVYCRKYWIVDCRSGVWYEILFYKSHDRYRNRMITDDRNRVSNNNYLT